MSLTYPILLARNTITETSQNMSELIRESALGQLIRLASGGRLFRYPEEIEGFQIPYERLLLKEKLAEINKEVNVDSETHTPGIEEVEDQAALADLEKHETAEDHGPNYDVEQAVTQTQTSRAVLEQLTSIRSLDRARTLPYTKERFEAEQILEAQRTVTIPIQPEVTASGQILVTWYTTDDQDNPHNWSQKKKSYVSFLIW
jgi:DHA1 family multidrug resistance protein-like MFS transporter